MSTGEELRKFYSDNYYKLVGYVMNKRMGGDKKSLLIDEAIEVVHDTFIYHAENPDKFSEKYIWNVLQQRRLNVMRDSGSYDSMKQDFYLNYYGDSNTQPEEKGLDNWLTNNQMRALVKEEIKGLRNLKHKSILKKHILDGEPLARRMNSESGIVKRFRDKMVEKYGDGNG